LHFYFDPEGDFWIFGGNSNFVQGESKTAVLVDWTDEPGKYFGVIEAFTPQDRCKTNARRRHEKDWSYGVDHSYQEYNPIANVTNPFENTQTKKAIIPAPV